jgi:quercetin 2,3-dioxygenase
MMATAAELIDCREVPLGGARAMLVRRTLPHRARRTIGAWCFVDQYGPEPLTGGSRPGMQVPPHPHFGLQTVSWLLAGRVQHRDSLNVVATIEPGELLLMTSGRGIAHSEQSVLPDPGELPGELRGELRGELHGVQLWIALPDRSRWIEPHVERHTELPGWQQDGLDVVVAIGEFGGQRSPALGYSPLVGAQVRLAAGGRAALPLEPEFEHGVVVVAGAATVDGLTAQAGALVYLDPGRTAARIDSQRGAVLMVIGGEPFDEHLLMWWNFVGRDHDEIVQARQDWQAGLRFGEVTGYPGDRLAAPALPGVRLAPRGRVPDRVSGR